MRTRKQSEFPRLRGVQEFDESGVPGKSKAQLEAERQRLERQALMRELAWYQQHYHALTPEQRARKAKQLQRLADHIATGRFPSNRGVNAKLAAKQDTGSRTT